MLILNICTFVSESPQAMINTLWLYFTMGFGLRGRHEHEQLLWGDIALKVSSAGDEFLEFNERATKTRQGLGNNIRSHPPKIIANAGMSNVYCFI